MSVREVGSYIGYNRVTSGSQDSASGIWSLAAAERRRRAAAWPLPLVVPQTISGLQLWLDASDASTLYDATSGGSLVAADGGVARWQDKSGNARHATQGTSANRPLRKTAIQGGLDVLRFDGSNDLLSVPSSTETFKFLHSADSTVFIVAKPGATSNPNKLGFLLSTRDGGLVNGYNIAHDDRTATNSRNDAVFAQARSSSGEVFFVLSGNDFFPSSGYGLISVISKPANATAANRCSLRFNGGTPIANNTDSASLNTGNATGNLTIGDLIESGDVPFEGDIAEIIIYDSALSDTDRAAVENYLLAKWGIT